MTADPPPRHDRGYALSNGEIVRELPDWVSDEDRARIEEIVDQAWRRFQEQQGQTDRPDEP